MNAQERRRTPARHSTAKVLLSDLAPFARLRVGGENADHVRQLAEVAVAGELPPIVLYRPTMRVIDGMHRVQAARLRGEDSIDAVFFDGSEDEAFLMAVRLNAAHGLPLTQRDRATAASRIIQTQPNWSDRAIAVAVGLSDKTVGAIRRRVGVEGLVGDHRLGRDGKVRPISSVAGRLRASELIAQRPDATLREIAKDAGISLGTARDVRERVRAGQDALPERQRGNAGSTTVSVPGRALGPVPPPTDSHACAAMLQGLRGDPSLRYSEMGRAMLRLLAVHSLSTEDWDRLVDSVPSHCVVTVVRLARGCAEAWWTAAQRLEQVGRQQLASGS